MQKKILSKKTNIHKVLTRIGFTVTFVMLFLSIMILGDATLWIIVSSIPLLLPLIFGNKKSRLTAFFMMIILAIFTIPYYYKQKNRCEKAVQIIGIMNQMEMKHAKNSDNGRCMGANIS